MYDVDIGSDGRIRYPKHGFWVLEVQWRNGVNKDKLNKTFLHFGLDDF